MKYDEYKPICLFSWYCVSQTAKRRDTLLCNQTQRGYSPYL
ncbi:hypothetical protein A628_02087 [Salmonella enterica subsp. enterica serovar Cubana str. 76814]|uniref:Uncharacterized protein n=1 Tax=Salmonella enterica subsp. enterica serovar Cubana str. 76814 TaxID=1192560 RepID=V7INY1_SALET|nr:hypothetical protein A628_02087 [Salmonella enterica subsp. enterica serovar Cubana str. 76814]